MLNEILGFILNIGAALLGSALLLRAWAQWVRLPFTQPLLQAVLVLTDWLVKPLRKLIPGDAGIDWASVAGAWLVALALQLALGLLLGARFEAGAGDWLVSVPELLLASLLTVLRWTLELLLWMTLLLAVLSWLNPRSDAMPLLDRLTAPALDPLRRRLPRLSGLDLSPLLLLVLVQIALMVLGYWQHGR